MSIEIYNKATVINKDDKIYYFLKYHSKNDRLCGGQVIGDILSIIESSVETSIMDLIHELLEIERILALEENK